MQVDVDKYSGRPIAADAYPVLAAFREAGARPFHEYTVQEVRELYVTSCEGAPLDEENPPEHTDFDLEKFGVRLYEPRGVENRGTPTPAVLFLHGGGWVMGNLRTHHSAARRIAARTGLPVLAVDYRLAPEHPYPAAIEDGRAAVRWLLDREQGHGLNVSSLSLVGDSAGGQLAAVLTNELAASGEVPLDAQVLLYPVTDLSDHNIETSASYLRMTAGFPLVADTMRWFADQYVDRGDVRTRADVSPQFATLPEGLPPTLVVTVDNDPLADEGERYAEKLREAGVDIRYEHLMGYAHGLFTSAGRIPTGEMYLNEAADFIAGQLAG